MSKETTSHSVADAMKMVIEARSIVEDGGKKVLGWEAQYPYGAAVQRLEQAISILSQVPGAEKQLANAYVVYGDLAREAKINGPIIVARQNYKKAQEILETVKAFDELQIVVEKEMTLGN